MSEMSQASAPSGGDPLDLVGAVGTEDDVLPGPPGGDVGEEGEDIPSAESGPVPNADPAPESGATLDPATMNVDPDAGSDPLDDDAEGIRTSGIGGSGSASDPMPDMTGTSG
jgi:hypothetical protein